MTKQKNDTNLEKIMSNYLLEINAQLPMLDENKKGDLANKLYQADGKNNIKFFISQIYCGTVPSMISVLHGAMRVSSEKYVEGSLFVGVGTIWGLALTYISIKNYDKQKRKIREELFKEYSSLYNPRESMILAP